MKMNRLALVVAIVLLLSACGSPAKPTREAEITSVGETPLTISNPREKRPAPLLECHFYEEEEFLRSVQSHPSYGWEGTARGGIVPHHLLAADMIAAFFSAAAEGAAYERVLIFCTSHYPEETKGKIITSAHGWNTPFGTLGADDTFVQRLLADEVLNAQQSSGAMEKDHGISGLIPYVKYYLPEVNVGVCLVPNRLSQRETKALRQLLLDTADEKTLLIGSVDFSHYLRPEEAAKNDEETRQAMEALAVDTVAGFTDDHADSPVVLSTLLYLLVEKELQLTELDHSSSPEKLGVAHSNALFQEGITTYFTYVITQ